MRLGSGEILHGRSERIWGQQANIHLHSAAEPEADFVFAAGDDLHKPWKFDDVFNQLFTFAVIAARWTGHQDVEITHGFAPPAKRPGRRDFLNSWITAQMLDYFARLSFRRIQQE